MCDSSVGMASCARPQAHRPMSSLLSGNLQKAALPGQALRRRKGVLGAFCLSARRRNVRDLLP
jgi:hypothetical protein